MSGCLTETLEPRRLLCQGAAFAGAVPTRLTEGSDRFFGGYEVTAIHQAQAPNANNDAVQPLAAPGGSSNLTANLALIDVYMTDANGNEVATPAVGSYAYMQVEYSTVGISAGSTYTVRMTVAGQNIDYAVNWGAGGAGTQYWVMRLGVWMITPGFKSASATLDVFNDITESNGADNTGSTNFQPAVMTPKFVAPLEGVPWQDWTLVNYVDLNLGAGIGDYNGGTWVYDGHNGWDYTIANWREADKYPGIDIYAAAAGTVVEAVDGNFDRNGSWSNPPPANYITIDHGNGFTTQYYHLRRDSVLVSAGQQVLAGQKIAEMASSGRSTNPHLHWGVYYQGMQVEPGVGMSQYMASPLTYAGENPSILDGGIISYSPNSQMYDGPVTIDNFNPGDQVTFWTVGGGAESGDTYRVRWYQPGGSAYATSDWTMGQGQYFYRYASLTIPPLLYGTWSVTAFINGVGMLNRSFTVQATARPAEVRMTQTDLTYIVDDRSTPFNVGTVVQGKTTGLPTFSFRVYNDGESDLTTSGLSVPAGFTITDSLAGTITPGSFDTVTLRLDSAYDGYKAGWVGFNTNDADTGEAFMRFRVEGTVTKLATVSGSGGVDTVYIKKVGSESHIWINTSTANPPTYELPTSELSDVSFNTGSGNDTMTVDYTAGDPLGGNITFTAGSDSDTLTIIGDAASTTYLAGTAGISLIGGDLISFSALDDLIVNAGDGDDVFTLNFYGLLDDLDSIGYDVDFNGQGGTDAVNINDTSDVGVRTYSIDYGTVTRSGWTHSVSFFGNESLLLNANNSDNTINLNNGLLATSADVTINANGGWDIINIGATSVSPIDGAVVVNGGAGFDLVSINDQSTITGEAWSIDSNSALRSSFGGLTYDTIEGLILNAQNAPNTVTVTSSAQNTPLSINANGGADTIDIVGHYLGSEVLVNGGDGDDLLSVNSDNAGISRVRFSGDLTFGSISIGAGGGALLSTNGNLVLRTKTLSINPAGFLDLADNNLILDYDGPSLLAGVGALLSSGYNAGAWNGNGIRSSAAAADATKALGYAASTDLFSVFPASFAGQSIDNTTVVVRYTFYGDANLDRAVNQADHDVLAFNWQQSPRRFSQADFNYDTRVNARDLLLMANNWNQTWPAPLVLPTGASATPTTFAVKPISTTPLSSAESEVEPFIV